MGSKRVRHDRATDIFQGNLNKVWIMKIKFINITSTTVTNVLAGEIECGVGGNEFPALPVLLCKSNAGSRGVHFKENLDH